MSMYVNIKNTYISPFQRGRKNGGYACFGFGLFWIRIGGFWFRNIVYFGLRASQRKMGKTYCTFQFSFQRRKYSIFNNLQRAWQILIVWLNPCIARVLTSPATPAPMELGKMFILLIFAFLTQKRSLVSGKLHHFCAECCSIFAQTLEKPVTHKPI